MSSQTRSLSLYLIHAYWGTIRALTCVAALSGFPYGGHLAMSPHATHLPAWACVVLLLPGLCLYPYVGQADSVASPHLGNAAAGQHTLFRKHWRTITAACGLMAFGVIILLDHLSSVVNRSHSDPSPTICAFLAWRLACITIASYALSAVVGLCMLSGRTSRHTLPLTAD